MAASREACYLPSVTVVQEASPSKERRCFSSSSSSSSGPEVLRRRPFSAFLTTLDCEVRSWLHSFRVTRGTRGTSVRLPRNLVTACGEEASTAAGQAKAGGRLGPRTRRQLAASWQWQHLPHVATWEMKHPCPNSETGPTGTVPQKDLPQKDPPQSQRTCCPGTPLWRELCSWATHLHPRNP